MLSTQSGTLGLSSGGRKGVSLPTDLNILRDSLDGTSKL